MQIALQDLRKLGFQKIKNSFNWELFIFDLKRLDVDLREYKSSPFGVPKKWGTLDKVPLGSYAGILKFMRVVDPTIDYDECTEITQRKFRNMWQRFSSSLAKDICCTEYEEKLIRDVGIKLIYYLGMGVSDSLEILTYYNAFITWYLFTLQETNFESKKVTVVDILGYLALYDNKEFVNFVNDNL